MIVFTTPSEVDAITAAMERGESGRWHGVFRLPGSTLFRVHADVYPSKPSGSRLRSTVGWRPGREQVATHQHRDGGRAVGYALKHYSQNGGQGAARRGLRGGSDPSTEVSPTRRHGLSVRPTGAVELAAGSKGMSSLTVRTLLAMIEANHCVPSSVESIMTAKCHSRRDRAAIFLEMDIRIRQYIHDCSKTGSHSQGHSITNSRPVRPSIRRSDQMT
jgi:hypothetical protein